MRGQTKGKNIGSSVHLSPSELIKPVSTSVSAGREASSSTPSPLRACAQSPHQMLPHISIAPTRRRPAAAAAALVGRRGGGGSTASDCPSPPSPSPSRRECWCSSFDAPLHTRQPSALATSDPSCDSKPPAVPTCSSEADTIKGREVY